jgi:cyanate permease
LPAQVLSQAVGPVFSGALHDLTGGYAASLQCFLALAGLSVVAALVARQPDPAVPAHRSTSPKGVDPNG